MTTSEMIGLSGAAIAAYAYAPQMHRLVVKRDTNALKDLASERYQAGVIDS